MATKLDRKGKRARWMKAQAAESGYARSLRALARQVGMIVKGIAPDGALSDPTPLIQTLKQYAQTIEPWARSVAAFMVADVARRDKAMWAKTTKEMSSGLRREIMEAPTGETFRKLQEQQVGLIKSIPLEAAQRVHDLAQEAMVASVRPGDIAKKILETEAVSASKARVIARTEVARAANNLIQARSEYAGSEGYIWRTSGDLDVRDSHREMEGKYVRWSHPPTLDGLTGHAGTLPNCRCFAEPIFPNE